MQVFLFFCYWYLFPNKLYRKRNYYPVYIFKNFGLYFYGFSSFFWFDKVWYSDNDFGYKIGDLISTKDNYFLCLGEEISFFELYKEKKISLEWSELMYPKFLSEKTINFINWMVYHRYSTYKSVMRYFLSGDVSYVLSKEVKWKKSKNLDEKLFSALQDIDFQASSLGQTLIVFPDLFTLYQNLPSDILDNEKTALLISTDTELQKTKKRRAIRSGSKNLIISTHSEVFQDFKDLKKIILFDPSKRYYTNQQDPRYKIDEVLKYLAEVWWIEVEMKWV